MSKNLKKMSMAFTAAPEPEVTAPKATPPVSTKANAVSKKIADLKSKAGETKSSPAKIAPAVKAAKTPAVPKAVKAPKEPKPVKPTVEIPAGKFTVAGTTVCKGEVKLRFANDLATRVKMFEKDGQTEINLMELPNPMSKAEIIEYFRANPDLGINMTAVDNKSVAMTSRSKKQAVTNTPPTATE